MKPFKVGDIVQCINDDGGFYRGVTKGFNYKVVYTDERFLRVIPMDYSCKITSKGGHFLWRFAVVNSEIKPLEDFL